MTGPSFRRARRRALLLAALVCLWGGSAANAQGVSVRIARQFGISYMPLTIMEQKHLLEAQGKNIRTAESLYGDGTKVDAVPAAFVRADAQQCGFCTPGFVVASTAFVRKHPNASLDDVRRGLGGNLCRCGTYAGMILAVVDAAKAKGAV